MTAYRTFVFAAIVFAAALGALVFVTPTTRAQPSSSETASSENPRPAADRKATLIGTNSCTAQGCHGGLSKKANSPIWGNEYSVWLESDPHAEAYSDLFQDRSVRMADSLKLPTPAHQSERCLTCHSAGLPAAGAATAYSAADGVSCEACHGAASNWVDAHTRDTWKKMTGDFQRDHHGLNQLKRLSSRAKKCAECHVGTGDRNGDGSPDRDMNHDLIAAGHPRLNFEFSAYLANYPKHWDERTWNASGRVDKATPPADFDARAWAIGQVAVAWAGLDLLSARAGAAVGNKPHAVWPELSEYSCFDCHHDLQSPSWRQAGYTNIQGESRRLGQPAWGSWLYPLLGVLAKDPAVEPAPTLESLATLRGSMVPLATDPSKTVGQAKQAAASLSVWLDALEKTSHEPAAIGTLLTSLSGDTRSSLTNWDSAAQVYLALVALRQTRPADAALDRALVEMADVLRFRPRTVGGVSMSLDSPDGFEPRAAMEAALVRFHTAIKDSK